jgi:ubiquinone/menaquinone biosynthesis C-methylase UbiE
VRQTPREVRAAYDILAREYAETFCGELAHKPLDRDLLHRFAGSVRGRIADLGCGPGQTTAFLHACGAAVHGLDLSASLLQEARRRQPTLSLLAGDMLALPFRDASLAGIVAFYAIVHFDPPQLQAALHEIHRVLRPGGLLLLSFHVGDQRVHVDQFLGRPVSLTFVFFPVEQVTAALQQAGFTAIEVIERDPYPDVEYPSRRAYAFASR